MYLFDNKLAHRGGLKTMKGVKYENQHESVWMRQVPLAQKTGRSGEYFQRVESFIVLLGTNSKVNKLTLDQ